MANALGSGETGTAPAAISIGSVAEDGTTDEPDEGRERLHRRMLFGVLAGAGAGIAGVGAWLGSRSVGERSPQVPDAAEGMRNQAALSKPSDAGGFASRDESLVAAETPEEAPAPPDVQLVWATPAEAAENTEVTVPTILSTDDPVLHLLRRTTFGPTPASLMEVHEKGIDAWIDEQVDPESIDDAEADRVWGMYPRASMEPPEIQGEIEEHSWDAMTDHSKATLGRQVWTKRQLYEGMVDFWGNHLHVAAPGGDGAWDVAPSYYNNVIRGHALGSFTDMLLAAMRHPAMLRYLSNQQSKKDSVNENLGRELLELHTVGIGGGYTEDDVRNSAYILTGRTAANQDDPENRGTFVYKPGMHWTGAVKVLDFEHENSSAEDGLDVGDEYLRYLASHPATARSLSRKLAVRFVSDSPPDELVDRLADKYLESGTEIVPVLDLLFRSSEFWAAVGQKTRRPLENHVATYRVLEVQPGGDTEAALKEFWHWTGSAGHQPLAWRPPDGYPDVYPPWRSASGTLEGWNTHWRAVGGAKEGMTYNEPELLVSDRAQSTLGDFVDGLCERLCQQKFAGDHRNALIAFAGADEASSPEDSEVNNLAHHLASLVLHSPYFALR